MEKIVFHSAVQPLDVISTITNVINYYLLLLSFFCHFQLFPPFPLFLLAPVSLMNEQSIAKTSGGVIHWKPLLQWKQAVTSTEPICSPAVTGFLFPLVPPPPPPYFKSWVSFPFFIRICKFSYGGHREGAGVPRGHYKMLTWTVNYELGLFSIWPLFGFCCLAVQMKRRC